MNNEETNHWWLNKNKFKRVRLSTLYRLGVLYTSETNKTASDFLLWLEKYMEEENDKR